MLEGESRHCQTKTPSAGPSANNSDETPRPLNHLNSQIWITQLFYSGIRVLGQCDCDLATDQCSAFVTVSDTAHSTLQCHRVKCQQSLSLLMSQTYKLSGPGAVKVEGCSLNCAGSTRLQCRHHPLVLQSMYVSHECVHMCLVCRL